MQMFFQVQQLFFITLYHFTNGDACGFRYTFRYILCIYFFLQQTLRTS